MTTLGEAAQRRVLVVDDDDSVREILALTLRDEGFDVVTAENGKRALATVEQDPRFSAIVLDLMMPVMNGWDFWDRVQQSPTLRRIPIVILTATGLTHGALGAATPILPKPVGRELLLSTLRKACAA